MRKNADRCPLWPVAQERAQAIAGCDANLRGDPSSRCQVALRKCKGGCDICQLLGGVDELVAFSAGKDEWPPVQRVPISSECPNGYLGTRATQVPGMLDPSYKFNWHLCHNASFIDMFAETIVHESMHSCASINPPGILDLRFFPPRNCSAEILEKECVGH